MNKERKTNDEAGSNLHRDDVLQTTAPKLEKRLKSVRSVCKANAKHQFECLKSSTNGMASGGRTRGGASRKTTDPRSSLATYLPDQTTDLITNTMFLIPADKLKLLLEEVSSRSGALEDLKACTAVADPSAFIMCKTTDLVLQKLIGHVQVSLCHSSLCRYKILNFTVRRLKRFTATQHRL